MVRKPKATDDEPDDGHIPLPVAPAELAYKSATENEVVRWVARNIDNSTPDPSECPDPFAWTLLRQCPTSSRRPKLLLSSHPGSYACPARWFFPRTRLPHSGHRLRGDLCQ